jgi:hypothetical protein
MSTKAAVFRWMSAPAAGARRLVRDLGRIQRLVTDPQLSLTYHPGARRKSRRRMRAEAVLWRLRHGEVPEYYFCWGLDLKGPRSDLLSYREFTRLRDRRNNVGRRKRDYTVAVEDKYVFSLLLEALGHPTPPILCVVEADGVEWLRPRRKAGLESLRELARAGDADLFCKPLGGIRGVDAFRLEITADGDVRVNGKAASLGEVAERIRQPTAVQQRIVQHEAMARLHPSSLNTVRFITVRVQGRAQLFSLPLLRTGVAGSVIDNGNQGGIQLFADPATGVLRDPGYKLRGGTFTRHPDTGVEFAGFRIPDYHAAVELVRRVHDDLPGLHSVGWDVAFTAAGPLVLEGNSDWSAALRIGLDPTFKRDFLALFGDR